MHKQYFVLFKEKHRKLLLFTLIILAILSCEQQQPNQTKDYNTIKNDYSPNTPEYYRVRDYQVFDQFKLAIKCPVKLNRVTNSKSEWQYAGYDRSYGKETYYEILSFCVPNFNSMPLHEQESTKKYFFEKFLSQGGKMNKTDISGSLLDVGILSYKYQSKNGKGIVFLRKERFFSFNIISDSNPESLFDEYIRSIIFYDEFLDDSLTREKISKNFESEVKLGKSRELRYLWFGNAGLRGFFNDGTMSFCPRCDLYKDAIDTLYELIPQYTYTIEPDGSLLVDEERIEYPSEEEIKEFSYSGWAMIDYVWMFEIEGIDFSSDNEKTEATIQTEVWFINTQFGLAFETPKALVKTTFDQPIGTEELIKDFHSYTFQDKDIVINFVIYELTTDYYNTKEGLRGAINNLVNVVGGRNLNLNYYEIENNYNNISCEGKFIFNNVEMKIHGYSLYKTPNRAFVLIGSGRNTEIVNKKLDRVFSSIIL